MVNLKTQFPAHLPVNPGAQTHTPFRPSLSQAPPFRQLTLAQGSLYDSQWIPAEKQMQKGRLIKGSPAPMAFKRKVSEKP